MAGTAGFLPGFEEDQRPKKKRVRPKRPGFDDSQGKVGPHGGILRRGKGKGRRYEDITGLKFGMWTVIEFSYYHDKWQSMMWLCECECGTRQVRQATLLMRKTYVGCRRCKAQRQKQRSYGAYWRRIKTQAPQRGYEFTLDFTDTIAILKKQGFRCALTGIPIEMALSVPAFTRGEATASLDRIDNSKGYIPGNVWWVHKDVNRMRWVLSVDRFIEICRAVVAIHGDGTCRQSGESRLL